MDTSAAERLFRHKVIRLLRDAGLLDEQRIRLLLSWRHAGFSVRGETHIAPTDRKALEAVARYMLRCPVRLARLVWPEDVHKVVDQGQDGEPEEQIDACEFVARVLAHVPDPRRHLVFNFGAYSNAARGKRKKAALALQPADEPASAKEIPEQQAARRQSWAQLIRRVYEVDPLICPKCAGKMPVVAVILDPPVVKKILDHLAKRRRAGRAPPHSPSAVVE